MIDDTIKTSMNDEVKEPEEKVAEKTPIINEPEITDVKLGFVEKRKFRFEGDFNRVLELNVSDLNVAARLKVDYPKLKELLAKSQKKVEEIPDDCEDIELLNQLADTLTNIDNEMRALIDHIFDAEVSRVCAPSGNMFDPVGGQFRFERVLDIVTGLYQTGLNAEFNKIKNRVETKASKYTKKYHK